MTIADGLKISCTSSSVRSAFRPTLDVADIPDLRIDKDLPELLANPFLQLVLVEIDAVFDQSAGLDVAIENYDIVTRLSQLLTP
jgi:hypothetical protein